MLQGGTLKGKITANGNLIGKVAANGTLKGKLVMPTGGGAWYDEYTGTYEVTPQESPQTLPTANKVLHADVLIKAIPSNYGRVTYTQDRVIKIT